MKIETNFLNDRKQIVAEVGDSVQINEYCPDYKDEFGSIVEIDNPISIYEKMKFLILLDSGKKIKVFHYQFDLSETSEYYTLAQACK